MLLEVSRTNKHENPVLSFSQKFHPAKISAYTVLFAYSHIYDALYITEIFVENCHILTTGGIKTSV